MGKGFIFNMCKTNNNNRKNYPVDPDGFWRKVGKFSDQGPSWREGMQISTPSPYELLKTAGEKCEWTRR